MPTPEINRAGDFFSFLLPLLKVISSRLGNSMGPRTASRSRRSQEWYGGGGSTALSTRGQSWGSRPHENSGGIPCVTTLGFAVPGSWLQLKSLLRVRGNKGSQRLCRLCTLFLMSRHHFDLLIPCWLVVFGVFW